MTRKNTRAQASVRIGGRVLTVFAAGYDARKIARQYVQVELAAAELAYSHGNRHGLTEALAILREHYPKRPWPAWVIAGVVRELEAPPAEPARGGRHARGRTRDRDYACDFIRATLVDDECERGASFRSACQIVSNQLRGDPGGSPQVIEQACERVRQRIRENPSAYYPLLSGVNLFLNDATKTNPPGL